MIDPKPIDYVTALDLFPCKSFRSRDLDLKGWMMQYTLPIGLNWISWKLKIC